MTDKLYWGKHDATKSKYTMDNYVSMLIGLIVVCLIAVVIIVVRRSNFVFLNG